MNIYEEMQDRAYNAGMNVIGYTFRNKTIKGLYCDGTAAISNNIDTNAEKLVCWLKNLDTISLLLEISSVCQMLAVENKSFVPGCMPTIT